LIESNAVPYRVDGGVGRYQFATHRTGCADDRFNSAVDLFDRLKGREIHQTRWFRRHGLFGGCTDLSYRKTVEGLNAVRQQPGATGERTLCNAARDEAARVTQHLDRRADELLCAPRHDPQGRPLFPLEPKAADHSLLPPDTVAVVIDDYLAANSRPGICAADLAGNPVPYEKPGSQVAIAVDDVGVKKQKAARKERAGKDTAKKRAWTTVAHVQHGHDTYTLTAPCVTAVLRLTCALLAASGMEEQPLLFFTDGQRTLKDDIFQFWQVRGGIRLILDWYHLQHKCKELGSLGLKGSIAAKRVHIEELRRLLWHGLVDRAIDYIAALPPDAVRKPEVLEQIKGYLERNRPHIPCYAVRQTLELRNSSNTVEKANDTLVAQRQKHNGMSWSEEGSHALGVLAALRRNGELDSWLLHQTLAFRLPHAA
jgi:hypothetical protein